MIEVQSVELSKLHPSKTNPRTQFDKESLTELAESIEEKGILNPLLVRSNDAGYEIVAGERRYRAAKSAGLKDAPCIIKSLTDEQVLEIQLIENLQRSDLHAIDEGAGFLRLKDLGFNIEQIAAKVSKQPWHVQRCLKYMDLIEPVKKLFWAQEISANQALLVARLQPDQQKQCLPWFKNGWSAASLKAEIERTFFLVLKDAPFDLKDAKLVPKAGSCVACPKRTGANKLLFPDIKESDTCTDPECFESKVRAFIKIQVGTHKDAILLTIGDKYDARGKERKGLAEWVNADDKTCPDTKQGIVVEKLRHYETDKQKAKLGEVLMVCTNLKCKTHNPRVVSDYDHQSGHSKSGLKARKVELRRRGLLFKAFEEKGFDVSNHDFRTILDHMVDGLSSDNARAVCNAMEWEPQASKYGGKDYGGTIAKRIEKHKDDAVLQWIFLLMLAERDLWFYAGSSISRNCLLEMKAKAAGVPIDEINKQAKTAPKKATPTGKKKKQS